MQSIVRKLFLATITLVLAIITFTGVTFAWLSINSDAWVEGMQIQATAGKGFLISVDGYNYYASLQEEDVMKAIIVKYRKSYSISTTGQLLDENSEEVSSDKVTKIFKEIKLDPCTSYNSNNLELRNVYGTKIDASKGEFFEFDLYFKSTGEVVKDINIYLNGLNKVLHQNGEEYDVNPTKITSLTDEVKLLSKLVIFDKLTGESIQKERYDTLNVKACNAMRLGIMNQQQEVTIVELTDQMDLGSYATNISEYVDSTNSLYDENIVYNAEYDAYKNAMFTYSSQMADMLEPIDYKKMPKTIKSLTNSDGENAVSICSLTKEESMKVITFKLWLEGWDADCIDGLKKSVSVQLSFVQ